MRAQQRIENAFLLEVDAAAHGAEVFAIRSKHGLRDKDDEVAGGCHIRLADDGAFGGQRLDNAGGLQRFALDLQGLGRCRQHKARMVEDGDGVEALGLQAQARSLGVQVHMVIHVAGQQLGAVVELLQR